MSDKEEKDGSKTEREGQILMLTDDEVSAQIKVGTNVSKSLSSFVGNYCGVFHDFRVFV